MRKALFFITLSLFALSASAQTLVTEGSYGGGEGANRTQVGVDSEGTLNFLQSCTAGVTTEAVEVDEYGLFSAAGQYGGRPHIGFGIVDPVDVHFIGVEDAGEGTLDIYVVEDSTFNILAHVVVTLGDLESLNNCGQ